MIKTFVRLLEESVLIQSGITFVTITAVVYMFVTGKDVPATLIDMAMLILGFYFGSKSNYQTRMVIRDAKATQHND